MKKFHKPVPEACQMPIYSQPHADTNADGHFDNDWDQKMTLGWYSDGNHGGYDPIWPGAPYCTYSQPICS